LPAWPFPPTQQVVAQGADAALEGAAFDGSREREYRRLAFTLAGARYNELQPLLERLAELEQQQREAEEQQGGRGGRGGPPRGGGGGPGGGGGGGGAQRGDKGKGGGRKERR
jgi:uncharacterized membrane protein YgcG